MLALACMIASLCRPARAQSAPPGDGQAQNYREKFDRSDAAIFGGRGYSESRNPNGELAWNESYLLMAYVDMYRATGDTAYLSHLVEHFDRMLKNRDDALGIADGYAEHPLAGWGSNGYSGGKWHVWLVHTGMICLGPAEFANLVAHSPKLRHTFGPKAAEYRQRLEESIRDAEANWRDGPRPDEGFYYEPYLKSVQPTNQQDVFGSVLLEMYGATGNRAYRHHAEQLAHYFHNRLRTTDPNVFDWAYWPRETADGPGSEDISHAAINIDFMVRCAASHIVFSRGDVARFGRTWLQKVRRGAGQWADDVSGKGKGNQYMPYAVGLWMNLCSLLPPDLKQEFYQDAEQALDSKSSYGCSELPGLARLILYAAHRSQ
jgi:hypothetical protein